MPNSIISEGKTTNEAIENGLKELKVKKNQVDIKVLENDDKRSFFSILAPRVVKVELTVKENECNDFEKNEDAKPKELKTYSDDELNSAENKIREFLSTFLKNLNVSEEYDLIKTKNGIEIVFKNEDISFLIGYRGDTLYSLQVILSTIASKGLNNRIRVLVDIEGYKEKREKTLENLADRMASQVIRTGRQVTLEPMKAYERKIIHSRLQSLNKITTHSIGEEPHRRLVISLNKK